MPTLCHPSLSFSRTFFPSSSLRFYITVPFLFLSSPFLSCLFFPITLHLTSFHDVYPSHVLPRHSSPPIDVLPSPRLSLLCPFSSPQFLTSSYSPIHTLPFLLLIFLSAPFLCSSVLHPPQYASETGSQGKWLTPSSMEISSDFQTLNEDGEPVDEEGKLKKGNKRDQSVAVE